MTLYPQRAGVLVLVIAVILTLFMLGCSPTPQNSDTVAQQQQETILQEAGKQVGMPAIVNFREKKLAKDIIELRDQADLVTYVYLENQLPTIVRGYTALGGKLTYVGVGVGFPLPYAAQFTSPQKPLRMPYNVEIDYQMAPQADPNGLFSPESASATWVMLKSPDGRLQPFYCEGDVLVFQFRLPPD